jgi:hypothetical protein
MSHPSFQHIASTIPGPLSSSQSPTYRVSATNIGRQNAPCCSPVTNLQPHPCHLASQQLSRPRTPHVVSLQPTYHSVYPRPCPSGHPHPKPLTSHPSDAPVSSSIPCYPPANISTQTPACCDLVTLDLLPHPSHLTSWCRRVSSD